VAEKAWGGVFSEATDRRVEKFTESVSFDRRLYAQDIAGSIAHAQMLAKVGLITPGECQQIEHGLEEIRQDIEQGRFQFKVELEDIHMHIERALIDRLGDVGRKLHTARSRNDQVATDLRLYTRAAATRLIDGIDDLRRALVTQARRHVDTLMPGYTHLQRAQPVRVAHHLLAYDAMLERDRGRIRDAAQRADICPLGSGALAGTTLPIDRAQVAAALGFHGVTHNSLDAVGDRDFAIELVAAIALAQAHLSRLGEELVLWTTAEFGFVRIGEAYCSGSSLMPQKMNPDLAELLRGKVGRTVGAWVTLMTVVKGLPLAYNKDLQETQEPFYDAVETARQVLAVMPGLIEGLEFDVARMRAAAEDPALGATDVAEELVRGGTPFRTAHEIVGKLVRRAEERRVSLRALDAADLAAIDPTLTPKLLEALDPARAVAARTVIGGPAPESVRRELDALEAELRALGLEL